MGLIDLGNNTDPLQNDPKKKSWLSNEILFGVCDEFWHYMVDNAKDNVWEGSLSKWFRENKKTHLYSPVMNLLYDMGCCVLQSRGGGPKPSLVRLIHKPVFSELEVLRIDQFFLEKKGLTRHARDNVMEQTINSMRKEMTELRMRLDILERRVHGND